MIAFQKNKKNFLLSENGIKRIKEDIKDLSKLPMGITIQSKEFDFAYYIKIIISKNNINIDTSNKIRVLDPNKGNAIGKGYNDRRFSVDEVDASHLGYFIFKKR